METSLFTIVFLLIAIVFVLYSYFEHKKKSIIESAKDSGIIINGEHFKVYTIYRCSSYTEHLVSRQYHDVHYFGEIMLVSSNNQRLYTTEKRLLYCLKVRKHEHKRKVGDGDWTNKWAEWIIDPDGWDEKGLSQNDKYLSLY